MVVPPPGRQCVLEELHETHPGVSKMKSLAHSYIWWPGMDAQVEQFVKSHLVCQESCPAPPVAPLHQWEWPSEPWSRIHIDFAKTIKQLRMIFATHGLPHKVVTDNGPSFTSDEFRSFLSNNGITHVTYHPSTNGLAERAVQTLKCGLKRTPGATVQEKLSRFLLSYRITPQSTTGVSPSAMLMGHRLRSQLDRLFPDLTKWVENQQVKQAQHHDSSKPLRTFQVADTVRFLHQSVNMDPQ